MIETTNSSKANLEHDKLIYLVHGAAAFQLLNAGVSLGLFELIERRPLLGLTEIANALSLKEAPVRSLLFGLTALELIHKSSRGYSNCARISRFFAENEWRLFKAIVGIQAYIMYPGQIGYVDSLRQERSVGVNWFSGEGHTVYERIKNDPFLHGVFYEYMDAYSEYAIPHLMKSISAGSVRRILDVGGGGGGNAITLARRYPDAIVTLLDLPTTQPVAAEKIMKAGLADRIHFQAGDMFADDFPRRQDLILFIHQLVIWSQEQNHSLIHKAFDALNDGGQVVIFSSISDDDEQGPLMAALDTVYFKAVAGGGGMIYPWKDYELLLRSAGFAEIRKIRCDTWTPHGVIVATKRLPG